MFFKRQTHSMGKNSRGEAATVAENASQRKKAREKARWPTRARVLSKVKMPWHRMVLAEVKHT
jgi:hypothetical protein